MTKNTATWLVQDKVAKTLIPGNPTALLPDGVAWWRQHSPDNNIANFAFGMGGNHMDSFGRTHFRFPSSGATATHRLCRALSPRLSVGVITNDIHTHEDADYPDRAQALPAVFPLTGFLMTFAHKITRQPPGQRAISVFILMDYLFEIPR
jgi:hypothetical protein